MWAILRDRFGFDKYIYSCLYDCLVGLMIVSSTAEQEVLGSIPGSSKVLLGFSFNNSSVVVSESELSPVDGNKINPLLHGT